MYRNVQPSSNIMGNQHVKPQDKLNYIIEEVNSLRYGIRNFKKGIPLETQQIQVRNLARFAGEVNSLRGRIKNKNLTRTMENISRTMNEILSIPIQNPVLDSAAIETDSFIDVSINKRHSRSLPLMFTKKPKLSEGTITKHVPTIKEIDGKFKSVKPQVILAIESKDSTQLRVLQQTIKVLATDLEMIEVTDNTPVSDRKEKLVSLLTLFYQKISVALKDIRKSRDMDFVVQQKKNAAAIRKLQEIRQELEATDALLFMAVKNEKPNSVRKCQEDLRRIDEELISVETIEDDIKATKMQMVDRIAWLNKYASDSQKKGSLSDLTKAQSNYEDLIKEIASGRNRNINELLTKFDSLGDFVNSLMETNETGVKQKMQLLNNINATKSSMSSENNKSFGTSKNDKDEMKVTSLSEEIDVLNNHWNLIESNLKSGVKFSEKDRRKIVTILGKLQNSISVARTKLLNSNEIKLGGKLNRSTPNLATSPPIHNKFSSSLSINYLSNSPQKIKTKIYDLKVPRAKVSFATKTDGDKKRIKNPIREDDTFSIIEGIRIQVNYIREKFDQIDDENHMKNKLESFREMLEKYLTDKNETIVNNAKLVLAEIQSLMRKISKLRQLKEIYLFGKIEMIQEDIERLRKIVNDYPEMSKCNSSESLAKHLKCCEAFLSVNTIISTEFREEMLNRFHSISRILEKKIDIKLNLDSLKEKVRRFSGAYKGVLYNRLEKDLNRILVDTSEYVDNKRVADDISRETEKQLKILENKASLAQSFRGSQCEISIVETGDTLSNLKTELETIRNELQGIVIPDMGLFRRFRSRLDLVTLNLYQLKKLNENEEQLKLLMYNDIDSLKSIVDAKIALGENSFGSTMEEIDVNENKEKMNIFDDVQEKLDQLKKDIDVFVGTTSDNKFYELDEHSLILASRMEDVEISKGTKLHNRKLQILKELYEYGNLLDKRAMETENLIQYERDISDIESNIEYYTKSIKDMKQLTEKLYNLKSSLMDSSLNEHLLARKNQCLGRIDMMMKKISAAINEYEKNMQNFEEEFRSLSSIIQTSTEGSLSKYNLLDKLINIKAEVEKNIPMDDSRKVILMKDIEILQKKMLENELVQDLLKQLNEFNDRVASPITDNINSLENDLKKFYLELDKTELSHLVKNPLIEKYKEVSDKLKKSTITKDTYIGSTAFLKDLEQNKTNTVETNPISKSLDASEKRIEKISADISLFNNSDTSDDYRQLEDAILKENVILKQLEIPKNVALNKRKDDLKRRIMENLDTLDKKVQTFEDLSVIECQLEELSKEIVEKLSSQARNELDEKLISFQVKLGQITVDDTSAEKKVILENRIMEHMKQIQNLQL